MQASEQANLDMINEEKKKTEIPTPMEPLVVGLLKSFIDDSDLSSKLGLLYKVIGLQSAVWRSVYPCWTGI